MYESKMMRLKTMQIDDDDEEIDVTSSFPIRVNLPEPRCHELHDRNHQDLISSVRNHSWSYKIEYTTDWIHNVANILHRNQFLPTSS